MATHRSYAKGSLPKAMGDSQKSPPILGVNVAMRKHAYCKLTMANNPLYKIENKTRNTRYLTATHCSQANESLPKALPDAQRQPLLFGVNVERRKSATRPPIAL